MGKRKRNSGAILFRRNLNASKPSVVMIHKCMYGYTYSKSMDQPGKVTNLARCQLNSENKYFPVRVRACEFGLARRVRQSRPASACSFSILRLNLALTSGIPPEFRGGVHLLI